VLPVLLAAVASVVVYRDVLRSYFWSDDFVLFYMLRDMGVAEFLVTPFGGHTVVGRNALFALTRAVAGFDPRLYFVTVLATHALNVLLLGRLIWRLTDSPGLAGFGALVWGICPTASESLAWYAASSQVVATTCLLLGFDRLARHDDTLPTRDLAIAALWVGLSLLFFGSAVAVALVWPAVVALLFPGTLADRRRLGAAVAAAVAVLVVYETIQLTARTVYATPDVPGQLAGSLVEHPRPALVAFLQLARVGVTSLALGAWWAPGPRSDLVSWLILLLAAAAWVTAFAAGGGDARRRLVAFTLVALAIYALTAAARAPLARQLLGWTAARLAATLRYHYAPQAFLVTAFCVGLHVASRGKLAAGTAIAAAWAGVALLGLLHRGIQLDLHDAARSAVAAARAEIEARVEGSPPGETVYIANRAVFGFGWMPHTMTPLPGLAALFVIISPADELDGRPVRFIESRPAVAELIARRGGRLARLIVTPPAAAAAGDAPR
jgi:hypothetical protein